MRRSAVILAMLTLVLGMVAGCAGTSSHSEQEEALDNAIHEVERALTRYLTVDPNGTAEEVERATGRVSSAWATLVGAAEGFEEVDLAEAQAAHDALAQAVGGVSGEATSREALDSVQPHIDAFSEAVEVIHDELDMH